MVKSSWAFNGQMLFFISLLCASCGERTTAFLTLCPLNCWGAESLPALRFPHDPIYHSLSLALIFIFILTIHLCFQLAFIISYTMSPLPQTPKVYKMPLFPTVFLYLNFLLDWYYYQLPSHSVKKYWCLPLFLIFNYILSNIFNLSTKVFKISSFIFVPTGTCTIQVFTFPYLD